jgi:hypothetical protein
MFRDPAEDVREWVSPLAPVLYGSIQHGFDAGTKLADDGRVDDPWLRTGLVRYYAGDWIDSHTADLPERWRHPTPRHNGSLRFLHDGGAEVRLLKMSGGTAPSPGHSRSRAAVWSQTMSQLRLDLYGECTDPGNILALWTPADDGLVQLVLVRPTGIWRYGAKAKYNVWTPLPYPDDPFAGRFEPGPDPDPDFDLDWTFKVDASEDPKAGEAG